MLDLDMEHVYFESSSTGHGHLVINTDLSFDAVIEILTVLNKHGIIQQGVLEHSKSRGYASLRVPGVSKYEAQHNAGFYDEDIVFPYHIERKAEEDAQSFFKFTEKSPNPFTGLDNNKKEKENEPQD